VATSHLDYQNVTVMICIGQINTCTELVRFYVALEVYSDAELIMTLPVSFYVQSY
jgi:hypothetical protein